MIYTGKVIPSLMDGPLKMDIMQFFMDYQPSEVAVPDDENEQAKMKKTKLVGVIAGEMKALIRKNENLVSRDCLILDLDDVVLSEAELIQRVQQKFSKFNYILYPSVSYGVKGVRYRLVIPLDQSINEVDYKLLVSFFSNKVLEGVINKIDTSNLTWSQIQLLPVITQYIKPEQIIISKGERNFPVSSALEGATKWAKDNLPKGKQTFKNMSKFRRGGSRYRNTTTELIESLVAGCEEGNRNNRIAQITGGLLARAVDVKLVYELVVIANDHFSDPLPIKEVENTFYSIAKKELS